jgi:PAS domain S-box-containing protein
MPYEEYFKTASESLIMVGRDGRILEVNPRTEELFGYSQNELVGQSVELLLPEKVRALYRAHREAYLISPRNRSMGTGLNLAGRRKDGSEFPVEVSLTYAKGTGRGDLVVAAVIDITERLALEQKSRQVETLTSAASVSAERLALERESRRLETMSSLGAIAAGIAHDLNNPLQVIRSRTELLLESPETMSAEIKEDLAAIQRQAARASRIVREFLELTRHSIKVRLPINLNQMVERALLLIAEQMRKAGISIETNLAKDLPAIIGDPTSLDRVLINLLSNALDAMPQGGAVIIASGELGDRPGWLYLSVADTGRGIAPNDLIKVFDLLYSTKASGTGLGLWLSRRLVQEHNGTLEVQSALGKGATFTIWLPIAGSEL